MRDDTVHFWLLSQGRGLLSTTAGKTGKLELTNTYPCLGNVSGVCTLGHTQLSQEQPDLSCVWGHYLTGMWDVAHRSFV